MKKTQKEIEHDFEIINKRGYKVVKSNELVQKSRSVFSYSDNRLVSYICSKIPSPILTDEFDIIDLKSIPTEYEMSIAEYAELCGCSDSGTFYSSTKDSLKHLRDTSFWIQQPDGKIATVAWLSDVEIDEGFVRDENGKIVKGRGSGNVKYTLHPRIVPYISEISSKYMRYEFSEILNLKKESAIPLFEFLKSHAYHHTVKISVEELRWITNSMEESYDNFKKYNSRIIKPCIELINNNTSIRVCYEKIGRPTKEIIFTIHENKIVNNVELL